MIIIMKNDHLQKHVFQQNRKKILFKEVVSTTRQAYEVLNRMTRYQNDLHNLNYNLIFQIKLEIDALIEYHEQILRSLSKRHAIILSMLKIILLILKRKI